MRREPYTYFLSVANLATGSSVTPQAQVSDAPFVIEETTQQFWQMTGAAIAGTPLAEDGGFLSLASSQNPAITLVLGKFILDDKAAQNALTPLNLIYGSAKQPRILTTPIEVTQKSVLRSEVTNNNTVTISGYIAFRGYKLFEK